jgi:peptide subunit release factor 1 (eRF1)
MSGRTCECCFEQWSEDHLAMTNIYRCPECGAEWTDEWCASADDDCPECCTPHISPIRSDVVRESRQKSTKSRASDWPA